MAIEFFELLIVIGIIVALVALNWIIFLLINQRQNEIIQDFTSAFRYSPHDKGQKGEGIVRMIFSKLPSEFVKEKWVIPQTNEKPDFAVKFPDIKERLIIDAKFIKAPSLQPDEKELKKLNRTVIERGKPLAKYIVPGETMSFVLMWVPDPFIIIPTMIPSKL